MKTLNHNLFLITSFLRFVNIHVCFSQTTLLLFLTFVCKNKVGCRNYKRPQPSECIQIKFWLFRLNVYT